MPKLLQVNITANWGSTGKIAEMIANQAKEVGFDCYMAYARKANHSTHKTIKIGSQADVCLHMFESFALDRDGLSSKRATRTFIKEIERIKPDIIHLHNIHGYYLNYPILTDYLSTLDIPIVWTLHDCWPFLGSCYFYDSYGCDRWMTGCSNDCPARKKWYCLNNRTLKNYSCKAAHFSQLKNLILIPVSEWMADSVRKTYLAKYPITTIHNGINTTVFTPIDNHSEVCQRYGIDEHKIVVLGLSNIWSKRKGFEDMLRLSALLPENYQMVLVGLNKHQMEHLPDGIIGLYRTDSVTDLQHLYAMAIALVNPTWSDNFPTTNIESLACGTPVITYRTGGSPEAVDIETGFVVEQGNVEGLLECILAIAEKGRGTYTKVCRDRAVCMFDQYSQYAKYINLYQQLIKGEGE